MKQLAGWIQVFFVIMLPLSGKVYTNAVICWNDQVGVQLHRNVQNGPRLI